MLNDFVSLLFPKLCAACGTNLLKQEDTICMKCEYGLPKTNFHTLAENPVSKIFYGRTTLKAATAMYKFSTDGKVQHLIHELKYKGQKNIAYTLGKMYGSELKMSSDFKNMNTIIPVPLHTKKYKKRGYNQSEYFAKGLSESMDIPSNLTCLARATASESQTKKTRFERWKNVETAFKITNASLLEGKHLLLVDDVVTTGATLEACTNELLKIKDVTVSIAAIAFADL